MILVMRSTLTDDYVALGKSALALPGEFYQAVNSLELMPSYPNAIVKLLLEFGK